jgi:hypothetical protein
LQEIISYTILIDAGADITALKRHGGWKSTTVAEGYIDTSMNNKMDSVNKIINAVQASSSSVRNTTKNKEITNSHIPPPPGGTAILPEYIHYYG